MEPIKTIVLENNSKELSRKVVFDEHINTLTLKTIWDAHGQHIPWEDEDGKKTRSFKDVDVRLEKVETEMYGDVYSSSELFINNKVYDAISICSAHGDTNKLVVTACIGQG